MHQHASTCHYQETAWGAYYCQCFIEQYQAYKVAPPPADLYTTSTGVFNVAELRELIMSFLPMLDLARMSRVNRHWYTSVKTSSQLRRQLFLKPLCDPVAPKKVVETNTDGEEPDCGVFLAEKFRHGPAYDCAITLNPRSILGVVFVSSFGKVGESVRYVWVHVGIDDPTTHSQLKKALRNALQNHNAAPHARCLDQYVTQPPCIAVKFACERSMEVLCGYDSEYDEELSGEYDGWIVNNTGVTLWDIVVVLRNVWEHQRESIGVGDLTELLDAFRLNITVSQEGLQAVYGQLDTAERYPDRPGENGGEYTALESGN